MASNPSMSLTHVLVLYDSGLEISLSKMSKIFSLFQASVCYCLLLSSRHRERQTDRHRVLRVALPPAKHIMANTKHSSAPKSQPKGLRLHSVVSTARRQRSSSCPFSSFPSCSSDSLLGRKSTSLRYAENNRPYQSVNCRGM